MARRRRGLPVNGVVLLDKPKGLSSNHALQRVRRLFEAQKAGHTGTLDPMATGLLPICLGGGHQVFRAPTGSRQDVSHPGRVGGDHRHRRCRG